MNINKYKFKIKYFHSLIPQIGGVGPEEIAEINTRIASQFPGKLGVFGADSSNDYDLARWGNKFIPLDLSNGINFNQFALPRVLINKGLFNFDHLVFDRGTIHFANPVYFNINNIATSMLAMWIALKPEGKLIMDVNNFKTVNVIAPEEKVTDVKIIEPGETDFLKHYLLPGQLAEPYLAVRFTGEGFTEYLDDLIKKYKEAVIEHNLKV